MTTFHIGDSEIRSRKKGNVYRKMFIYLLRKHSELSLHEIGEFLGMKYRTVAELQCYFFDELTKIGLTRRMVHRVEQGLRKMALLA